MKRILIISELFYPQNVIGALRPTKIREYLVKKGYVVDVITKSSSKRNDASENGHIWRIDAIEESVNKKSTMAVCSENNSFIREMKCAKRTFISIKKGYVYCRQVVDFIKKQKINVSGYSAIITTFGPVSSVMIGLTIKKKFHNINWICDFRDPMVAQEVSIFFKPLMALIQKQACREADNIITVSNGYLLRICGKKYTSKRHMIPNGYDTADMVLSKSCHPTTDLFHIVYVGSLYEGKRKITPLFQVLQELANEGILDLSKISFDYAGRDHLFLLSQAKEYDLDTIVHDHGFLSRSECLKLQFSAHLLVLSTWNNRGEEGVFPGKFLEYMMIRRPIISITDGNIPNGEVTLVMRDGKFGVAYEAACHNKDIKLLKDYIETCYTEWMQKGFITFEPVQEVLARYNYDHIIEQIEELICEK